MGTHHSNSKPCLLPDGKRRFRDICKPVLQTASMPSTLGQRIKAARLRCKLTQQQVADACGIDRAAVSQWESSDPAKATRPSMDNLRAFQKMAKAPWDWLQSDESELGEAWDEKASDAGAATRPDPSRTMTDELSSGALDLARIYDSATPEVKTLFDTLAKPYKSE